jgi:hypothetical protein
MHYVHVTREGPRESVPFMAGEIFAVRGEINLPATYKVKTLRIDMTTVAAICFLCLLPPLYFLSLCLIHNLSHTCIPLDLQTYLPPMHRSSNQINSSRETPCNGKIVLVTPRSREYRTIYKRRTSTPNIRETSYEQQSKSSPAIMF